MLTNFFMRKKRLSDLPDGQEHFTPTGEASASSKTFFPPGKSYFRAVSFLLSVFLLTGIFGAGMFFPENSYAVVRKASSIATAGKISELAVETVSGTASGNTAVAAGFSSQAPAALLMEASTGTVLYEKDADTERPPASVTKVMTLLLIFEALEKKQIALKDVVTVSEHAASMGGSQVFLEAGETQTVDTMLKCIAVSSANDACVAMAEYICGSEDAFVQKMNEKAKALGMNHTNFVNCCGLDADNHYTCARDIALMSRELITKYPDVFHYTTIWMENITHVTKRGQSEFGLSNTNKLIRQYQGATGLKTGSTSKAGFCLSATAEQNGISLIAVVMACSSSKERVTEASSLLDYGFSLCKTYSDENPPSLNPVTVNGGTKEEVSCTYEKNFSCVIFSDTDPSKIKRTLIMKKNLSAPVEKGQAVGCLRYSCDGKVLGELPIYAAEAVKKAHYLDYYKRLLGNLI